MQVRNKEKRLQWNSIRKDKRELVNEQGLLYFVWTVNIAGSYGSRSRVDTRLPDRATVPVCSWRQPYQCNECNVFSCFLSQTRLSVKIAPLLFRQRKANHLCKFAVCIYSQKNSDVKISDVSIMDTFYLTLDKFRTKLSITSLKQRWRKFTLTKQVVACNSNSGENDCFTQSLSRFYRHTDEKIRHILWTRYVS